MRHPVLWHYFHYSGVIMGAIASQITSLTIVYSTVCSDADQWKHQSSASLAFVWGIHRGPVNSPHKWQVTGKCVHLMTSSWNLRYKNDYKTSIVRWTNLYSYIKQSDFLLMILAHGLTITILRLLLFLDMRFEYIKWGSAIMVRKRREMWIALPCSGESKWTLGNRCKKRITSSWLTGTERKDP